MSELVERRWIKLIVSMFGVSGRVTLMSVDKLDEIRPVLLGLAGNKEIRTILVCFHDGFAKFWAKRDNSDQDWSIQVKTRHTKSGVELSEMVEIVSDNFEGMF